MAHITDDRLPAGMFEPDEEAIIAFAKASALFQPITDELWDGLRRHFNIKQTLEIVFLVGMSQLVSRFHAAVRTDVDAETMEAVGHTCQVRIPPPPAAVTT